MLLNPRLTRAELVTALADITEEKIRNEGMSLIHDTRVVHRVTLRPASSPDMKTLLCGSIGTLLSDKMTVEKGEHPIPMFVAWLSANAPAGFAAYPGHNDRNVNGFADKFDWSMVEFMRSHNAGVSHFSTPFSTAWLEYQVAGEIVNDITEPFAHPSFKLGAEIAKEIYEELNNRFLAEYTAQLKANEAEEAAREAARVKRDKEPVDTSKLMMVAKEEIKTETKE